VSSLDASAHIEAVGCSEFIIHIKNGDPKAAARSFHEMKKHPVT
jgi:hypothetical protein